MNGEVIYAILTGIVAFVGTYAVMKNNVERLIETNKTQQKKIDELETFKSENEPLLIFLKKNTEKIERKFEEAKKDYYELKGKLQLFPTFEAVRQEFASKEDMKHMKEMIETRFDNEQKSLESIVTNQKSMMDEIKNITMIINKGAKQ